LLCDVVELGKQGGAKVFILVASEKPAKDYPIMTEDELAQAVAKISNRMKRLEKVA